MTASYRSFGRGPSPAALSACSQRSFQARESLLLARAGAGALRTQAGRQGDPLDGRRPAHRPLWHGTARQPGRPGNRRLPPPQPQGL